MQAVLSVDDVRGVELALKDVGVSLSELMHRAGSAVAKEVRKVSEAEDTVVVLAGFGNNGGDGWVAAEMLRGAGLAVTVVTPIEPEAISSGLARAVALSAQTSGVPIEVAPPRERLEELLGSADVVVDAMLGTGFHGVPKAPFDVWIDVLGSCGATVVAADVPSGLSARSGLVSDPHVIADVTVTMIALKPGLLSDEGRDACGAIVVVPLAEQTEELVEDAGPVAWRAEAPDYFDVIVPPSACVDKYTRGSVLVVGGSRRYTGAAVMAAKAAARAGAGYVTLAVPERVVPIAQAHLTEIPVVGFAEDPSTGAFASDARDELVALANRNSAVVVGPGMTVTTSTMAIVSGMLQCSSPLVLDADALNCLARLTGGRVDSFPELLRRDAPLVLTPHRRELGRLVGMATNPPATLVDAIEAAQRIVWSEGGSELCVVAKGPSTACVGVDVTLLPKPGPAALATAGSGDVLSGAMAATLAHAAGRFGKAALPLLCSFACEVHGCAGAIAAGRFGSRGVMAGDVADALGLAVDVVEQRATYPADLVPGEEGEE